MSTACRQGVVRPSRKDVCRSVLWSWSLVEPVDWEKLLMQWMGPLVETFPTSFLSFTFANYPSKNKTETKQFYV